MLNRCVRLSRIKPFNHVRHVSSEAIQTTAARPRGRPRKSLVTDESDPRLESRPACAQGTEVQDSHVPARKLGRPKRITGDEPQPLEQDAISPRRKGRLRKDLVSETTPQKPSTKLQQGSSHHNSLSSFLAYAHHVSLPPTTTSFIGTHYEYTVASSLSRPAFGFDLLRTGRASDLGIDLLGTWALPERKGPIKVLVQCKAVKTGVVPAMIRELEGAFVGAPASYRLLRPTSSADAEHEGGGVIALLVATGEATRGVRDALARSLWPMGFLNITKQGVVRQFLWNERASAAGLEGLGATLKYGGEGLASEDGDLGKEIALTWMGRIWSAETVRT
ncbi:hypothetical protein LTR66_000718 [Elasticomyces elasticus]|nr:hypothetical protein LTR28_000288 [Elasticomyces elasticus]KAK4989246.1 hypothetical protein LTR50_003352 [Elasticomyces elasticus]KAK5000417.1 hypothetical protein LTR66_000718 [Elasticomyces elasticus]